MVTVRRYMLPSYARAIVAISCKVKMGKIIIKRAKETRSDVSLKGERDG